MLPRVAPHLRRQPFVPRGKTSTALILGTSRSTFNRGLSRLALTEHVVVTNLGEHSDRRGHKASVAFYGDVLGATVLREGEPTFLRLGNLWLTINGGRSN